MNEKLWWYIARSSGIVSWAVLAAAVIWGLLLSTRLLNGRPAPKWLLDLHRHLGGTAIAFTVIHLVGLVADSYSQFGPSDLLVPFASAWKPLPVALGVVAMYLLVAVEGTSLVMKRIPRRWWRWVHRTSFGIFWLATIHGVTAGTDTDNPMMWFAYLIIGGIVVFLTLVAALSGKGSARAKRTGHAGQSAARRTIVMVYQALLGESHPEWVGHWRDAQVWIGGSKIGPYTADYLAPHHDRVPSAVADLVDLMDRDDMPMLVRTSIAHADTCRVGDRDQSSSDSPMKSTLLSPTGAG